MRDPQEHLEAAEEEKVPEAVAPGTLGRRNILKAAGVGLAATAALTARKAFAQEPVQHLTEQVTSRPPLPEPVQDVGEAVFCQEKDGDQFCGTLPPPTPLGTNQIEVVVPANRKVLVTRIPADRQPLAEVVVRISRDIRESRRGLLLAEAFPTPTPPT